MIECGPVYELFTDDGDGGTEGSIFGDLENDFFNVNDLDAEDIAKARALQPRESMTFGGDTREPVFTLRRLS
jgi:hypothetical protein